MPVATTLNVAEAGALTVRLAGCVVMPGATFTVKVAAVLVTLPAALDTTTSNVAPLSDPAVGFRM